MTVAGLLVAVAGLSGGCIDAVNQGIADGIMKG
jgi:hypothetical protein